jgi:hypothetical protein
VAKPLRVLSILIVLLFASSQWACIVPIRGALPKVRQLPTPRAPKPSVNLVLEDLASGLVYEGMPVDLPAAISSATVEAALFEKFWVTTKSELASKDAEYTIRLEFGIDPRFEIGWNAMAWSTLFILPGFYYHRIYLFAKVERKDGVGVEDYLLEDELKTAFAAWGFLLWPFYRSPASIVENLMMTLYLRMAEDGILESPYDTNAVLSTRSQNPAPRAFELKTR